MSTEESLLEDLMSQLGVFGKYQLGQHVLHLLASFLGGMHMFSLVFVAPTPSHRCFIEELDQNGTTTSHTFDKEILSQYIPSKSNGELNSCLRYTLPSIGNGTGTETRTETCDGQFVYDTSIYQQSRVYDWDLVCENKWKRAFIQSIYVFGVLCGALLCGSLADKYGRKNILCISALLQFSFALVGPRLTNYVMYCISLFFYGMFGSGGAFVTAFVLSMEIVNKKNRAYFGSAFTACFATGACFVGIWSYLIRDVTILQTVFAAHSLLLFGHWWLIDESIRWLWSQGRTAEAISIVRKGVKLNGGLFDNLQEEKYSVNTITRIQEEHPGSGLVNLFRKSNLRFRAIITAFSWFSLSLCFYGLAFNTGSLPGNPYLVFFLFAIADIPGNVLATSVVNKTGRRSLSTSLLFLGGLACIITTLIPKGIHVTVIALLAKSALAGCFAVMYNYTAELFPTVVRNSAIGFCSMATRLGGTLTPQITLLESVDKSIPVLVFGSIAILAAFVGLFLPETLGKELSQTLEDGENFGKGDTAFISCFERFNCKDKNQDITPESDPLPKP